MKIPIISIANVATNYLKNKSYKTVGILATYTTVSQNIYGEYLDKENIRSLVPTPDDQKIVEQVILSENAGKISSEDKAKLVGVMKNLQEAGAETMLLACTELPVLISQEDTDIPLVDCNELYAIEAAKLSYGI